MYTGKSAIDIFGRKIIFRISFYLSACAASLLFCAIVLRQMRVIQVDGAALSMAEEITILIITVAGVFISVCCAGFLAFNSVKHGLELRSRSVDAKQKSQKHSAVTDAAAEALTEQQKIAR